MLYQREILRRTVNTSSTMCVHALRNRNRNNYVRFTSSSFDDKSKTKPSSLKRDYPWASNSTSSSSSSHHENNNTTNLSIMANVVQGPSLLLTTLDRPSPTLMILPGLRSLPFWTHYDSSTNTNRVAYQDPTMTRVVQFLQDHVPMMTQEYMAATRTATPTNTNTATTPHTSRANNDNNTMTTAPPAPPLINDYHIQTEHSTLHTGEWEWYSYMQEGLILTPTQTASSSSPSFATHFPQTTNMLQTLQEQEGDQDLLLKDVPFGYCFFSKLSSQSTIAAHSSPINFRLRIHVPLIVPTIQQQKDDDNKNSSSSSPSTVCGIRVGPTIQSWIPGQVMLLDDSYNHEVWNHHPTHERVLLLMDVWHPDVRPKERTEIKRMFQHAQQQGWLKKSS